ncbi:proline-rich protein 5 isoform X5 [Equus asinus]|uniref:proline-rich protein 5 isoform X5 n=1 Tax=Equus asinus TaxID=9793 RepID=UPI0038F80AD5
MWGAGVGFGVSAISTGAVRLQVHGAWGSPGGLAPTQIPSPQLPSFQAVGLGWGLGICFSKSWGDGHTLRTTALGYWTLQRPRAPPPPVAQLPPQGLEPRAEPEPEGLSLPPGARRLAQAGAWEAGALWASADPRGVGYRPESRYRPPGWPRRAPARGYRPRPAPRTGPGDSGRARGPAGPGGGRARGPGRRLARPPAARQPGVGWRWRRRAPLRGPGAGRGEVGRGLRGPLPRPRLQLCVVAAAAVAARGPRVLLGKAAGQGTSLGRKKAEVQPSPASSVLRGLSLRVCTVGVVPGLPRGAAAGIQFRRREV